MLRRRTPLARGAGILRTTELQRRTPITTRTPIKPQNRKRLARLKARAYGPQAALCWNMPCAACDQLGEPQRSRTVAAHLSARGMGGVKGDDTDNVPLCAHKHHPMLDDRCGSPEAFEAATGVDLVAVRDRLRAIVEGRASGLPAPWCYLPY